MIKIRLPDGRVVDIRTDDPQVAARAAKMFTDNNPVAPAVPSFGDQLPERQPFTHAAPPAPEPPRSILDEIGRSLQIGSQGVAEGVGNLLGAPGDIAAMIGDAGRAAGRGLTDFAFGPEAGAQFRDIISESLAGQAVGAASSAVDFMLPESENIKRGFGDLLRDVGAGGAIIPESDMSPRERIAKGANTFGTEALIGSAGALRAAASKTGRAIARPILAPEVVEAAATGGAGRVLAGDTAAGASSGAFLHKFQETNIPDTMRKELGPIGEAAANMATMLAGVTASRMGARGSRALRGAATSAFKKRVPSAGSKTGNRFSQAIHDASAFAARGQAASPGSAAAEIRRNARLQRLLGLGESLRAVGEDEPAR